MDMQAEALSDDEKREIDEAIAAYLSGTGNGDKSPMGMDDVCRLRSGVIDVVEKVLVVIPSVSAKTAAVAVYAVKTYLNIRCSKMDKTLPTK